MDSFGSAMRVDLIVESHSPRCSISLCACTCACRPCQSAGCGLLCMHTGRVSQSPTSVWSSSPSDTKQSLQIFCIRLSLPFLFTFNNALLILAFLVTLQRGGAIPPPRLNPVPDHRTAVRLRESSQLYGWWHSYGFISATYLTLPAHHFMQLDPRIVTVPS